MYTHKNGITFNKLKLEDASYSLGLREESWHGLHKFIFVNLDDQKRWIEKITSSTTDVAVVIYFKDDKHLRRVGIGLISNIDWISQSAELSGSIAKEYRKTNVSRCFFEAGVDFAFEMFNLRRISAEVLETNKASLHLIEENLPFKREGVRRKAVYKSGKYVDSILMGMLREEWQECPRVKAMNGICNINMEGL